MTMKNLVDHLSQYATYHREPRNIVTHFVGIPLIVLAVAVLLSRPGLALEGAGSLWLSPALAASVAATVFYLRLDIALGIVMGVLLGLCVWCGAYLAQQTTITWLGVGIGLFIAGWIIQFVGHYYEGRKPAFIDDISGLIIGPLFVVAEAGFLLGLRAPLRQAVEARAGVVRKRDMKKAAV